MNNRSAFKILVIITLVTIVLPARSQLFKKHLNQLDENGLRKGNWITYWDDEKEIPMSKARFENGREVGVSKEYHMNGNLRLKFRYHKDRIRVKFYSKDRRLEQKGWSVIEFNEEDTHYYWQGKWKFYDDRRKLARIAYFEKGEEVQTMVP